MSISDSSTVPVTINVLCLVITSVNITLKPGSMLFFFMKCYEVAELPITFRNL